MIPILYIGNGCFTKHPIKNGCFGFQEALEKDDKKDTRPTYQLIVQGVQGLSEVYANTRTIHLPQ